MYRVKLIQTSEDFAKMEADQKTYNTDMHNHSMEKAKGLNEAEMAANEMKSLVNQ